MLKSVTVSTRTDELCVVMGSQSGYGSVNASLAACSHLPVLRMALCMCRSTTVPFRKMEASRHMVASSRAE